MINFGQKFLLVVLLLGNLSFTPPLLAQDSASPPSNITIKGLETQVKELKNQNEELKKQNEILNKQLEHMSKFDGRILSTVWYALGVVGTVAFIIAGFSWLTYKSDKDEFKNLREEYMKDLKDTTKEPYISLKQASVEAATKSASETAKVFFNNNVEDELRGINQQISSINTTLRELSDIKYRLYNVQAKQHKSEGYFDNALRRYLKMIDLAVESNSETWVQNTLDAMQEIIEQHINLIDKDILSYIKKRINNLPKKYEDLLQIDKLNRMLASAYD
ncbi:MAG: bZIP transcription factor [Calothrix sp. MO_167.B12]|nr:bZIP transcription factor [Calothrix sp. MO_167.B12]